MEYGCHPQLSLDTMLNNMSETTFMKSSSSKSTRTRIHIQPNSGKSENLDWPSPSSKRDEDLSALLWKIKLASISTEDSDELLEENSQVARLQSISPYLLDGDRSGSVPGSANLPTSLFALGNISDSSLQSDSSSHWMSSTYSDPFSEDAVVLFPNSCSSIFSNSSPNWRMSERFSPVSPIEKHFFKASYHKTNTITRQDTSDHGIRRKRAVGPKVVMLVLLAHLEHVYRYACVVQDLLKLYSIQVNCKIEEDGSSILPEHVASIANRMPETTRIMLIGPRHVVDGTCHFQTRDGRCIESTLFVAIGQLLEENVHLQPEHPKRNESKVGVVSPYCSSVSVFVNKMIQRLNTRHSLHSQLLQLISICDKCSKLFKRFLKEQSPTHSFPVGTLVSALHTVLPRRLSSFLHCRAAFDSHWTVDRKKLYLLWMMRHWEFSIHSVRERCTQLYLQLSHMETLQNDLEREMRLFLLNQLVDRCNALDRVYQEMKQVWNALVTKWL
ncbi:hypothetical protein GpartN1_g376.t1 [Galdieria partita]|uniref:Uncharacterized protein n=1 Tax=Galdieria partita TaxID=83374 RepID=A0A9C7PQG1_9RHOD|nr:hypothetical protein GpartN1_g376.t1 [Galdieria partita]